MHVFKYTVKEQNLKVFYPLILTYIDNY